MEFLRRRAVCGLSAVYLWSFLSSEVQMSRMVRCGLIQASNPLGPENTLEKIKKAMIEKHLKLIDQAARKKVQILCLQEIFYGPYFCAEQNTSCYALTEGVPYGRTITFMPKIRVSTVMVITFRMS